MIDDLLNRDMDLDVRYKSDRQNWQVRYDDIKKKLLVKYVSVTIGYFDGLID